MRVTTRGGIVLVGVFALWVSFSFGSLPRHGADSDPIPRGAMQVRPVSAAVTLSAARPTELLRGRWDKGVRVIPAIGLERGVAAGAFLRDRDSSRTVTPAWAAPLSIGIVLRGPPPIG